MIYKGSNGNLSLHYKGLMISNYPLTKNKNVERYKYQGQALILDSLNNNLNLKKQIYTYLYYCNIIYNKKLNRQAIYRSDHHLFISCFFALIKLKIIEEDDMNGYLIME
tara:strand:+ start:115 stop:441 length:327 start_codon:yes stop_codon:yes gene_type:complete